MHRVLPSQARLKELLDYDPLTGGLVWKLSPANNIPAGAKDLHGEFVAV